MNKVVNLKCDNYHIYIGRKGQGHDGYFGNPVAIGKKCPECGKVHRSAGSTLDCYETYLTRCLKTDVEFNRRFYALKGKILGCFCKPGPCHGDIMAKYLEKENFPMSETLTIFADGGCKGNHKKGDREAYCSISVRHGEKIIRIRPDWVKNFAGLDMADPKKILTIKLNKANTNNEAEFGAAITALGYVDELHRRNPNKPLPPIQIKMDSDLIVSAIKGDKKIKAKNLVGLLVTAGTIFNRLAKSLDLTISRIPRTDIETVLGH